jgi:4-amino-4-deoxy-L-arabinose transferase
VLAFAFQGSRGLFEPDEGRYSDVALQMLDSGDLLVPHLDPEHPHFTKPPLTYWSIGAGIALLGRNEWGVRLASALAFVVTGLVVFAIARRGGSPTPLRAAGIWATMVLPFAGGTLATTDPLLAGFEALAGLGFVMTQTGSPARGRWLLWTGLGLAFATKGPPGLLPGLAFVAYAAATRRGAGVRELIAPGPVAAFAVLALAWFAWIVERNPAMFRYFLLFETFDRIATDVHHRNPGWSGLVKAYGPTVLLGTLPWLPLALARVRRAGRGAPPGRADSFDRLLLTWLLLPLLVFCLAQSRLPLYLLPLAVPLALWISRRLDETDPAWSRRAWLLFAAWAAVLVATKFAVGRWEPPQDSRAFARELRAAVDMRAYDEIQFVESAPRYGLVLYLGRPVEAISLAAQPRRVPGVEPRHDLCLELDERERALLLVRDRDHAAFEAVRAKCRPGAVREAGRIRDWRLYAEMPAPR